jgi:hypothetical protein
VAVSIAEPEEGNPLPTPQFQYLTDWTECQIATDVNEEESTLSEKGRTFHTTPRKMKRKS